MNAILNRIPLTGIFLLMLVLVGTTGCDIQPRGYYPTNVDAGYPVPGTFEHRLQTEMYDAARKYNRATK